MDNIAVPTWVIDPDNTNRSICQPFECLLNRYIDLPFLDPVRDKYLIDWFMKAQTAGHTLDFLFLEGMIFIVLVYLGVKFTVFVPEIATAISGSYTLSFNALGQSAENGLSFMGGALKYVGGKAVDKVTTKSFRNRVGGYVDKMQFILPTEKGRMMRGMHFNEKAVEAGKATDWRVFKDKAGKASRNADKKIDAGFDKLYKKHGYLTGYKLDSTIRDYKSKAMTHLALNMIVPKTEKILDNDIEIAERRNNGGKKR
jgi:hypothetical protein